MINFNDTITEGYIFLSYNQRASDLLNDDRDFLPVAMESDEVRVIAKRAIMEIELLDEEEGNRRRDAGAREVIELMSGNAYDILSAPQDADDAELRAAYLAKVASVDPERIAAVTGNPDLARAAEQLVSRYSAAYDAIAHTRQIEAIADAVSETEPDRRRRD